MSTCESGCKPRDANAKELGTPTSQSHSEGWQSQANSDSFTGWPWRSERKQTRAVKIAFSSAVLKLGPLSRFTDPPKHYEASACRNQGYGFITLAGRPVIHSTPTSYR